MMIDPSKSTVICGDFNICYKQDRDNKLIKALQNLGFRQTVTEATHIDGGLIDHVYIREAGTIQEILTNMYSPYYTALDHDAICITLKLNSFINL